jgi:MSHA biogenesis protein MshP
MKKNHQAGFAFITAIFLLVTLAAFAAFVVTLTANASATTVISVMGIRGYQAARAGIEWASYQIKDPNGTIAAGATNLPACFVPTSLTMPGAMGAFSVSVSCQRFPASGSAPTDYHEEGNQRSVMYVVTSTATFSSVGTADYIERRLEVRIEKCKDPSSTAPTYAC